MVDVVVDLRRFLDAGGLVLWFIGGAGILLGALIIERYWYCWRVFPHLAARDAKHWRTRRDRQSRQALRLRQALIVGAQGQLQLTLPVIGMLVALCPLLGLFGTVTGMMSVFDVLAVMGTGNARAMASGISQAIIPTMAGMVVALPGLYFKVALQRQMQQRLHRYAERLLLN